MGGASDTPGDRIEMDRLFGRPEEKRQLWRPRYRWEYNINVD